MSNGHIAYAPQWDQEAFTQPTTSKDIGYSGYGYKICFGYSDSSAPINGRFPIVVLGGSAYTEEAGIRAFQKACTLMASNSLGLNRPVKLSEKTSLDRDVSGFAVPSTRGTGGLAQIGMGADGATTGGTVYTLDLEVPIFRPQLAAINSTPFVPGTLSRFGNLHANCVGDGYFLGSAMTTWWKENQWQMARPPKLHFVDFNEIADVVAKWVAILQQAALSDPVNSAADPLTYRCPLTLQEMTLLLRNVVMQAFKETQIGVQGTYPVTPSSSASNDFVPFVSGTSTCFLAPSDMNLPLCLIENIRSLTARFVHRGKNDYEWFMPVLGIYSEDVLNEADYFYVQDGDPPVEFSSFTPAASVFQKKILSKTGTSFAPMLETVISLVDGSYSAGYAFINDPAALKQLATRWNDWLTTTNLSQYSMTLTNLGTENGINILTSINMTRHWADQPVEVREKRAHSDIQDVREITARGKRFGSRIYETRMAVADSAQSRIVGTAYEQIQNVWVLPINHIVVESSGATNFTLNPRWQSIMGECFEASISTTDQGITISDQHHDYAALMTKSKLDASHSLQNFLVEMAATGRGGILSGLVASFADAIVPGAGSVVRTIGGAIGV